MGSPRVRFLFVTSHFLSADGHGSRVGRGSIRVGLVGRGGELSCRREPALD